MSTKQYLMTVELPEGDHEAEKAMAADLELVVEHLGHDKVKVEPYTPELVVTDDNQVALLGRIADLESQLALSQTPEERDAYGNPYNPRPAGNPASGRDHYGNLYDKNVRGTNTHDAYGNPFEKVAKPKFTGKKDNYGNPHKEG